jgi:hypothetical protein
MADIADVLQVGALINLGQILPGLDTLAAKTANTCEQMTMSFAGPAQASLAFGSGFALSVPEIVKIPPAVDTIPPATARAGSSAMQARMAMMGMGQEMGVALPRFVRSFLTSVGPVAGIMAAAFLPVAIIGVVEWLAKVPSAIENMTDSIMGYGEAQKEAFKEAVKASDEALTHAKSLHQAQQNLIDINKVAAESGAETMDLYEKAAQDASKSWWNLVPIIGYAFSIYKAYQGDVKGVADAAMKAGKDNIEAQATITKLTEAQQAALLKNEEEYIKLGEIGASSYKKTQVELQLLGLEEAAELERVARETNSDKEALRVVSELYETKRKAATLKAGIETGTEGFAAAKAEIDAHKGVADAIIAQQLALVREEVAIDKDKWPKLIAAERLAENEMYADAVIALKRKKELAAQDAALHGKSGAPEAATINGEIEALAIKHQTKLDSISSEGVKHEIEDSHRVEAAFRAQFESEGKVREQEQAAAKRGDEEIMRGDEERVSFAAMIASRTLRVEEGANADRLRMHKESLMVWAADETASINKWYSEQHRLLELELADAERIHGVGTTDYMRVVTRMEALDQERALKSQKVNTQVEQNFLKTYNTIAGIVNHNITSWITGHETFGQMVINIADEMATAMINFFMKEAEQYLLSYIMKKLFAQADVTTDAGRAGAAGYASVMEAIPFPANVALAPVIAAMAIAQTMAVGSFDEGGLAQKTGLAMVHQGEIAMPVEVSSAFRSMAAGGTLGGRVSHHHTTFNLHHNGPDAKEVLRNELVPMIRQAQRRGELAG